ncbi:hypothetical protein BJF79_13470 [Actinomadura sp. CNU-125]|uniref:hypothetical protein n=1 Tax=Actinomadura sp. CNU-125 TaxID=1904961 RepID=UPI0009622C58|nr:hypothetical protein [Actinomadura sp. CNU-125]OLT24348.1 hypothetical protein BJF79_13470 [Actinomadura sp. CNU-125]
MSESLADRLALAAEQPAVTNERISQTGMTADDMHAVAAYFDALTQHGYHVCSTALRAVERAEPGHPARSATHGFDLQATLAHAMNVFDVLIHFAADAQHAADAITHGETNR